MVGVDAGRVDDHEQDVLILLQYYDEYKPAFATRERCEKIIGDFKGKARAANKQTIRTQAHPDWRELMYSSIKASRGVDPRTVYDLAIGTTVANGLAARERGRTEKLRAARKVAWEDQQREKQKRETSLGERQTDSKAKDVAHEREVIEKPWRHTAPQTVLVTVPPGGISGQVLTVTLANGSTIYPTVPPDCPPGQQFSAPAVTTKPEIRSLGGGYRVTVDSGRNPYAVQTELVAEPLNPNHPAMPHIDMWHSPQFNPAPRGGLAESEYQDRYLGYWRSNNIPGLGQGSSGGERDNQWLTEINDQNYFARLPESRKEPQGASWGAETGSKRGELGRILRGANGTMAGPHAESLLDDVQMINAQADAKLNFKNRPSMLFGQKQGRGLEVLKR